MLAEKFTVIAPDLPGIGDSSIPESGLDIKTSATRIHALVRSLGIEKARVVGHDTWHFRFNGEYPEALVKGRERTYFESFWNVFTADKNHSIPEADRKAYTEAYSKPGRMRAAWAYFASWPELAKDFARLSQTKLILPVLSIGGEKSLGNELADQMKLVADDGAVVVLKNAGHLVLEERPKETTDALVSFL
jgi:pimeloyl-ACP methyl ester carboxylesterase